MTRGAWIIATVLAVLPYAVSGGEGSAPWDARPRPLKGDYQIYGGTLSEMLPPTAKDRKVAVMLGGTLAKDLFDQIGPDRKMSCSDAPGYRERRKGDLSCTYTRGEGYACYIGIDITTGKSMLGSIC